MLIFYQSSMPLKTILALEGSRLGDGGQKSCVIGVKIFIFNQQNKCKLTLCPLGIQVWIKGGGGGGGGGDRGSGPPWKITSYMGFYRE